MTARLFPLPRGRSSEGRLTVSRLRAARIACISLALLWSAPVVAETFAITGATVALGDGSEPIPNGMVLVRDGRIVAAGGMRIKLPAGTRVIDATGKWVTPGIVGGLSQLGISEVDLSADGSSDISADDGPFSAAIDVVPSVNPLASTIAINRADGVTRALVVAGAAKSIFAGQGAVIDTGADMDAVTAARVFQYVELGETGADKAGGSRSSAHALFRNALREAGELARFATPIASASRRTEPPVVAVNPNESLIGPNARRSEDVLLTRFDAAALVPVLQGRQYLFVHAERASDILAVLALKKDFPRLKLVLVGATEGWTVARRIAAAGIPVITSGLNDLPSSFEQIAATQSNVGRLRDAGVKVALSADAESRYAFRARQYAGNLVSLDRLPGSNGVRWGEALAMITSRPAEAIGMGGDFGSLAPGRRADVVIWSGDPLETTSAAEAVFIDGERQPLENRQTRLLDRYRDLRRQSLPEAYRH